MICTLVPRLFFATSKLEENSGAFQRFIELRDNGHWIQKNPSLKVVFFQSLPFASMLLTISDYINTYSFKQICLECIFTFKAKKISPHKS